MKIMDTGKQRTVTLRLTPDICKGQYALWICLSIGLILVFDHVIVEPSVSRIKQCLTSIANEIEISCMKP